MEILIALARLQHAHVSRLMAAHTNVIREVWSEMGRIDDMKRRSFGSARTLHRQDVSSSGTVAVLAADRKLGEWCAFELTVGIRDWPRPSAVAKNASSLYRAIEA